MEEGRAEEEVEGERIGAVVEVGQRFGALPEPAHQRRVQHQELRVHGGQLMPRRLGWLLPLLAARRQQCRAPPEQLFERRRSGSGQLGAEGAQVWQ